MSVALVGALDVLTPGRLTPHEVAAAAHRVETEMLGQQCGIQDQLARRSAGSTTSRCSSTRTPRSRPIQVPNAVWWELERRLSSIYLGKSHGSSAVHETVIRALEDAGPDSPQSSSCADTAPRSRDALYAGDFEALGRAMIENTEAQAAAARRLVGTEARRVIEIARAHGALGLEGERRGRRGRIADHPRGTLRRKRAMIRAIEPATAASASSRST